MSEINSKFTPYRLGHCDLSARGFATYASNASFGHPVHFFNSLDTQKFMSGFADDDFSYKIDDVAAVVSLL